MVIYIILTYNLSIVIIAPLFYYLIPIILNYAPGLIEYLQGCNFIITPTGKIITSDGSKLSKIFINYLYELSPIYDGRISDLTAETQGVMLKIPIQNNEWIVGLKYEVASPKAIIFFVIGFVSLLIIYIFVILYFSNTLTEDISIVGKSLNDIVNGTEINLEKKIPVTSNDEIGDLVIAFNKILDLEKKNLETSRELAVIKERTRFSRDVHDTLGQTITLLVTLLNMARSNCKKGSKTEEYLIQATQIAEQGLRDVQRSAKGLVSEKLETNNLINSLQELALEFNASGVNVDLNICGMTDFSDPQYTDAIFRICQEAMTNSVRHGKAKSITIMIEVTDNLIKIDITDDGQGCKTINKGSGLSGMEQRIISFGGTICFKSDGIKGFTIHTEIPIERKIKGGASDGQL